MSNESRIPDWLRTLPSDLQATIIERSTRISVARSQAVFSLFDPPGGLYGVVNGHIGIQTHEEDRGAVLVHLVGAGGWFGVQSVMLGGPRRIGAVALSDSVLISLSLARLQDLLGREPAAWRHLGLLVAINAGIAAEIASNLLIRDPERRCLATLGRLVGGLGGLPHALPLTQDQLSDMCGLSRGAISGVLNRLERRGMIERGYREIRVLQL